MVGNGDSIPQASWLDLAEEALTRVDGRRSADLLRQFHARMMEAAAYWCREGDENEARRCVSAATWAAEHLGWIQQPEQP
jgi:hypothetical protein